MMWYLLAITIAQTSFQSLNLDGYGNNELGRYFWVPSKVDAFELTAVAFGKQTCEPLLHTTL